MMKINKKAQTLGGVYSGILIIAAIGIMLALVMYILTSMGSSFQAQETAATVTNETGTFINATGDTLAGASALDAADFVITAVWASQHGAYNISVPTTNVTVSSTGVVTNATATTYALASVSYTYTYTADTTSSNATTTIVEDFVDFLPWLGIILLVLAAGVVLFIVIRSFAGTGRGI